MISLLYARLTELLEVTSRRMTEGPGGWGESTLGAARDRIGGLSRPSKMPGWSVSLPATRCQTGAQLAKVPGSVCSSCYALKGRYLFKTVQDALERRWGALPVLFKVEGRWQESEQVSEACDWIAAMARAFGSKSRWVRVHDSGDIQSPLHLVGWAVIARLRPDLRLWLPTREVGLVRRFVEGGGEIPPNMVVRLSIPMIGAGPTGIIKRLVREPGISYSTVDGPEDGEDGEPHGDCLAYQRGGVCGACRLCWSDKASVNYPLH